MLYRILTQNKNRRAVEAITSTRFSGFTTYTATGYWHGKRERSLIIEVHDSPGAITQVSQLALDIRQLNHQQVVMVQQIQDTVKFI